MKYIDIHTHTYYDDPETIMVLNMFPDERSKLDLPVFLSAGLHPWHTFENTWAKGVEVIGDFVHSTHVIAVGETGLDKAIKNPWEIQLQAFTAQLSVAESNSMPVIIHCVHAYSEMLSFRKKSGLSLPWIFHWFNASGQTAAELIRKNCYLSFGHMLFNEQSKAFRVFREVPLDHVFFETDDAGVTIRDVYARAAEIRKIPEDDLKKRIMDNFGLCFHR